jgi:hypothetical protein
MRTLLIHAIGRSNVMSGNETTTASSAARMPPNDAASRTDTVRALATARAHFVRRGWRPLAIEPPALRERCEDVTVSLLMNDAGETLWLSTRDWSALPHPLDAFRREMACVRAARVDRTILVHDGDFPDGVVEAAAHAPQLRLIDAAILREMAVADPPMDAAAIPASRTSASAGRAPTRAQRFAQPAWRAARYLSQVVDARAVAAAERYLHETFARRLRQIDGERRRLKTLGTAALMAIGASIGFFAFNLVWLQHAPEDGDSASVRVARTDARPLPQPLAPPQGYVAQAAGVSSSMLRVAHASSGSAFHRDDPANVWPRTSRASMMSNATAHVAMADEAMADDGGMAPAPSAMDFRHLDIEETQRRADEAIKVIASSTPEVGRARPPAATAMDTAAAIGRGDALPIDAAPVPEDPARVD